VSIDYIFIEEYAMDGIANVARQQQTQMNVQDAQSKGVGLVGVEQQRDKSVDMVKEMQDSNSATEKKINSKEEVKELIGKLNDAMAPITTNIKFAVDMENVFYVSVVEAKTNKMIRRFPAEQAFDFLPKMQEVTGILFDSKG
jgi:flagellar protein FlaG